MNMTSFLLDPSSVTMARRPRTVVPNLWAAGLKVTVDLLPESRIFMWFSIISELNCALHILCEHVCVYIHKYLIFVHKLLQLTNYKLILNCSNLGSLLPLCVFYIKDTNSTKAIHGMCGIF